MRSCSQLLCYCVTFRLSEFSIPKSDPRESKRESRCSRGIQAEAGAVSSLSSQVWRQGKGDFFLGCLLMAEVSTPFVCLGKILIQVRGHLRVYEPAGRAREGQAPSRTFRDSLKHRWSVRSGSDYRLG